MVSKFLQTSPLGIKSLFFQLFFALILFAFVFFLRWNQIAFLTGFLFSQIYMFLFFYSAFLIFQKKRRKLGLILMFLKWFFLLFVLITVSLFLEGRSFLLGLTGLLSFLLCYVFENLKRKTMKES